MTTVAEKKYEVFRGISDVVIAPITKNTSEAYEFGDVRPLAGIAKLTKTTETSQEPIYFDNIAAMVISGEGADTLTMETSAVDLETLALITGRYYNAETGAYVETPVRTQYFAVGYKTGLTGASAEHDRYVWRYVCQFSVPDEEYNTKEQSTTYNGQTLNLTCVYTTKKLLEHTYINPDTGESVTENVGAKALVVENKGLADLSTFFDKVTLPEEVKAKAAA